MLSVLQLRKLLYIENELNYKLHCVWIDKLANQKN